MIGRLIFFFLSCVCLVNADSKILGYDSKDVTGNLSKLVDYSELLEEDKKYTLEHLINETLQYEHNSEPVTEIVEMESESENFVPFPKVSTTEATLRILPTSTGVAGGRFPFFVSLSIRFISTTANYDTFCGGVIISESWVLTAAECVYKAIAILVTAQIMGTSTLPPLPTTSPGIATIHPGFRKNYMIHNIALVRVTTPFTLSAHIYPIKLSKREHELNSVTVTTMGIGPDADTLSPIPASAPAVLNFVDLVQLSKAQCNLLTKEIFVEYPPTTSCLSSSSKTKGFCLWDAGGPVIYTFPNEVSVSLLGITSEYQSCLTGYPMSYTKIAPYYHWIKSIVKKLLV